MIPHKQLTQGVEALRLGFWRRDAYDVGGLREKRFCSPGNIIVVLEKDDDS